MSLSTSPFCENCGAANEKQAIACRHCGHSLQESADVLSHSETGGLRTDDMLRGRYRVGTPIGQGGMGTVYRARDLELNDRLVAVKEVIISGLNTKEAQEAAEAFKREATFLASLQHPNLPNIFDHFEEKGRWYLVMSFIQGEALENYLERQKQGKLPVNEVLQIGKQLCTVLHYLHSQRPPIVFRDLKPANIMRTQDGHIYLIDFGVARHFKPGQKKDTISFGSVGYAPPEQFGKAQTTPRSDIYALGATMHRLLSGHDPDTTSFRFPLLQTLVSTIPAELATLIAQMLEMDEKKRPENLLIVEQRLQEIANAAPRLQPSLVFSPSQQAPKTQHRSLRTAGLLILATCCLLVGGFSGNLIGTQNATNANAANQATIINATGTALDTTSTAQANAAMATAFNGTATAIVQTVTVMPDPNTTAGALPAPQQIAPLSGTVFNNYPRTLTLRWNAVSGAVSYTILIYYYQPGETNCTGGTPLSMTTDLTSTSYTFEYVGAQPGCWQVWAVNAAGNGQKSPLWEFSFTQ